MLGDKLDRLLGVGAYGEVWVAVECNTGRRVTVAVAVPYGMRSRETLVLANAPTMLSPPCHPLHDLPHLLPIVPPLHVDVRRQS